MSADLLVTAASAPQGTMTVTTIGEFFSAGGTLMWPILGASVVVVGLAIERYLSLRAWRIVPPRLRESMAMLGAGRFDEVAGAHASGRDPVDRVLTAALRRRGQTLADVEKALEDQLATEASRLRGNVRGISLMAAIAPLLGLLGTVLGIAEAFATVEQTGLGKPENLASGIKVALYTTIFGLFVAIPATLLAAHLQARVRRLVLRLGETLAPATVALAAAPALTATAAAAVEGAGTHAA